MIEQIVDFTLGFVICGLIGTALLPMVSARARRLTLKKIEDRLPVTFDQVEAERDLLRARFAVEKRDLEERLEAARGDRASEAAELGRRAVALTRTTDQLTETRAQLDERNAQLAKSLEFGEKTKAELEETRAELATRSHDLVIKSGEFDRLAEQHRQLDIHARETDALLARATADLAATTASLEATEKARAELSGHADHLAEQGRGLATALAEEQERRADFEARRQRLLEKIAVERRRGEELENTNLSLRRIIAGGGVAPEAASGDVNGAHALTPQQELLDLREAITRIGRHVAKLDAANE